MAHVYTLEQDMYSARPEHFESFPLVPLEKICLFDTSSLSICRERLIELSSTLSSDPEDICLGQYIKKQLAVVVTEIEDRRAKQRIADLITGKVASTTLPALQVTVPRSIPNPPSFVTSKSASKPDMAPAPTIQKTNQQPPSHASLRPSLRDMKAIAKSTKLSADEALKFVVQGKPKVNRKKKAKPKEKPPPSPEEILQKQREERRRLAHARLLARQSKVTQKKIQEKKQLLDAEPKSNQEKDDSSETDGDPIDAADISSDEYVQGVEDEGKVPPETPLPLEQPSEMGMADAPEKEIQVIEDDERITRINNELCKIQAEDNLQVLKMNGQALNSSQFIPSEEESSSLLLDTTPVTHMIEIRPIAHLPKAPANEVANEQFIDESNTQEKISAMSPQKDSQVEETDVGEEEPQDDVEENSDDEPPVIEVNYDLSSFHSQQYVAHDDQRSMESEKPQSPLPKWFQEQKKIADSLTHSVSEQTFRGDVSDQTPNDAASMVKRILSCLTQDKQQISICQKSVDNAITSLAQPDMKETSALIPVAISSRPKSCKPLSSRRESIALSDLKKETLPVKRKPLVGLKTKEPKKSIVPLLKTPTRDVKEYTSIFRNFHCVMTSFFERTKDAESNQTISKEVIQHGDGAIRFQLKLYTVWKNIMHDYATVFGVEGLLKTSRDISSSCVYDGKSTPFTAQYRINSQTRQEVFGIVVEALKKIPDWEELPVDLGLNTTWNLLWTWSKPRVDRQTLLSWQKVNHFAGAKALTRKDMLKKSLQRYVVIALDEDRLTHIKQAMGDRMKGFDIAPETFILPNDYISFVQSFKRRGDAIGHAKNFWIMKPVALSRGRGISLLNDLGQVAYGEAVIVQKYIENPLLLDGFKFDLRLYVLVTSFNPLEAYFYNEGFVRICTHRYSTDASDLNNLFMHLTNSSIQKYGNMDEVKDNPVNNATTTEAGGTKASLAYLWARLEAASAPVAEIKASILDVIVKSLVAGEDSIPYQVNSFDLYGYDILLDTNYRPWLIEINSSPSMARENNLDYVIKDAVLYDTIRLVKPLHYDRAALISILKRRADESALEKKRPNLLHPLEAEERAKRQLNEDLTDILRGQMPRQYGEVTEHMGNFQRIAPSPLHSQIMKIKRSCFRESKK